MSETRCRTCGRSISEEDAKYCQSCNAPLCKICYDRKNGSCDSCELNYPKVML